MPPQCDCLESPCLKLQCSHSSWQVTNLSVSVGSSKRRVQVGDVGKLKRTHNIHKLIELVDKATRNFVAVGEQIASENPDFQVRIYNLHQDQF